MRRMDFSKTFARFHWAMIEVIDVEGQHIDGIWQESALTVQRVIRAIPLAMSSEDLKLYPNGDNSEGGITLTTADSLYFTDINAAGLQGKQSYVIYQGYKWRVVGNNLMQGNVKGLSIYTALRFIE